MPKMTVPAYEAEVATVNGSRFISLTDLRAWLIDTSEANKDPVIRDVVRAIANVVRDMDQNARQTARQASRRT